MLDLMYITNRVDVAKIAEEAGVQQIFIDMEYIGKADRQGGMDTVQNRHTINDIRLIKPTLKSANIMARCNPIHDATENYPSSKEEVDGAIEAGADILMLPYFKTAKEVETFIKLVDGRARVLPLVETPEAVNCIDEILLLEGLEEIFVGLNDLSLGYGKKFMFELLSDGTVENLCKKFKAKGISYGFGGIAALGKGVLPAERIVAEHYRLGSTKAILSRSFCNVSVINDVDEIRKIFNEGLKELRAYEEKCSNGQIDLIKNKIILDETVKQILENIG